MKRFVIIRHAKSSWDDFSIKDFDRTLNARGIKDAPEMGKRLHDQGWRPDAFYVSTAKRTQQTAEAIKKSMNFTGEIHLLDWLYHAPATLLEDAIATADDQYDTIFIIAHNPGVSDFLTAHCPTLGITDMPTCAAAGFTLEADSWTNFHQAKKTLIQFDFPKNIS